MVIHRVKFAVGNTTGNARCPVRQQDYCTRSDIHAFISAIADRTLRLEISRSHEILPCVLSTPGVDNVSVERMDH